MKTATIQTDILSEEFEIPSYNADLQTVIEFALLEYQDKSMYRKERRDYRNKLNELIEIYNERRGMSIYLKVQ